MSYYPYIFDVNRYIKQDASMVALCGGTPKIFPLVGYETSEAPFIRYWFMPGNVSRELYFVRCDYIRYHILDTNADRGFKIAEQLLNVCNKGDGIQGLISSSSARVLWMVELRSGTGAFNAGLGAPREREGFYEFQLIFEMGYVPLD